MKDEMLAFEAPKHKSSIIKVLGIGGGGSNAVTHMYKQGIKGVDFIICNTDAQAMDLSPVPVKIQLGAKGLGAGARPEVGRLSAEENIEDIRKEIEVNTKMLFVTAGMGGGTGTGAAPVIAKVAKELGILTVGIVTIPFMFEGRKRRLQAEEGIEELRKYVDTLLIISNDKLREMYGNLKLMDAFSRADDILTSAAKGIAEIITVAGYINVDFEDVKTVMQNSGTAIMGSAVAEGEDRARIAVKEALSSPLLNDNKITGASDILLYIASGKDEITFDEVTEITDYIMEEAGQEAEIIWGNGMDESLDGKISITLIATGFKTPEEIEQITFNREKKKKVYTLDDKLPDDHDGNEDENAGEAKDTVEEEISEIVLIKKDKPENTKKASPPAKPAATDGLLRFDHEDFATGNVAKADTLSGEPADKPVVVRKTEPKSNLKIRYTLDDLSNGRSEEEPQADQTIRKKELEKKADDRVRKLKELSLQFDKSKQKLEELEAVPAYVRKNVELNPVVPSSETVSARYVLSDDENKDGSVTPRENPYLHNNPD